jgi:YHS domain-containing protein
MVIRLILWAVVGFLVYTVVQAAWRAFHAAPPATPPQAKSRGGEAMERDPHCGTFVPRGDAVEASVHGERRWFCSARCRDEYLKKP